MTQDNQVFQRFLAGRAFRLEIAKRLSDHPFLRLGNPARYLLQ